MNEFFIISFLKCSSLGVTDIQQGKDGLSLPRPGGGQGVQWTGGAKQLLGWGKASMSDASASTTPECFDTW